jgi:hypothetical protein
MLQVQLPEKIVIDVGWYPDCDPKGSYRLRVFHQTIDRLLEPAFTTRATAAVKAKIESLALKYAVVVPKGAGADPPVSILSNGRLAGAAPQPITNRANSSVSQIDVFA